MIGSLTQKGSARLPVRLCLPDLQRRRYHFDLVAEPHSLPVPPTTAKGFVKNRSLRAKLQAFIRREPTRDLADYFARVETMITDFHRGENDRGWVANLDWAIRPKTDAAVASTEGSRGPSAAELEAEIVAIAALHNKGGE